MTEDERQTPEEKAFNRGFEASMNGFDGCPYGDIKLVDAWNRGYKAGRINRTKKEGEHDRNNHNLKSKVDTRDVGHRQDGACWDWLDGSDTV